MQVNDSVSLGQAIRNRRKELSYTQKYISELPDFYFRFCMNITFSVTIHSYYAAIDLCKYETNSVTGTTFPSNSSVKSIDLNGSSLIRFLTSMSPF